MLTYFLCVHSCLLHSYLCASWIIGVILAALGSIISNLGVTLQKLTHLRLERYPAHKTKPAYWRVGMWQVGIGFVVLGSIADVVALSFAPQSLIAPLGALTMVSNVVFAPLLLKEKITKRDIAATMTILAGSIIAVAFGSHSDIIYSFDELISFLARLQFILYATIVTAAIIGMLLFLSYMERLEQDSIERQLELPPYYRALQRFAYPAISGTIGAQSVLFAKCVVELVVGVIKKRGNAFVHFQPYLIIVAVCVTVFLQIKWLNDGLKRFDASYIVPVFVSFWIVLSVASGMIFYQEYVGMKPHQAALFSVGVILTIAGVALLSLRPIAKPRT